MTLQEKWLFGSFRIRSRIRAFNKLSEAEQLMDLSQYIILFALHQLSVLPLDRTRFLLIAHRE